MPESDLAPKPARIDHRLTKAAHRTSKSHPTLYRNRHIVGPAPPIWESALRQVETLRPNVVLVDVSLGDESGFELARRLVADHARGASVILISTRSEADLADAIAQSPAAGFLSKSALSAEAIRGLLDGS